MCGRFSLTVDLGELARRFEFEGNWLELKPNYNVAPPRTSSPPATLANPERLQFPEMNHIFVDCLRRLKSLTSPKPYSNWITPRCSGGLAP